MSEANLEWLGERIEATLERLLRPHVERLGKQLDMPAPAFFSVRGAASFTGLSAKHIRRALKRGEFPCSNVGGDKRATLRIARRDIEDWFQAHRVNQCPRKAERDALSDSYFAKRKAT